MDIIDIRVDEGIVRIEDLYVDYSPYLSSSLDWNKRNGIKDLYIEDVPIALLSNYVDFLRGEDFNMEEDDEQFFEFMGHPNLYNYPLDVWRMKLRSKWIRDNFNKYNLCDREGGLYGLMEIPMVKELELYKFFPTGQIASVEIPRSMFIAGGAALYMSGYTDVFTDIDVFPTNKEEAISFALKNELDHITSATASGVVMAELGNSEGHTAHPEYGRLKSSLQLIKREYRCPSEVVHSFDIDSTGFIVVDDGTQKRLYATELAIYAGQNKKIWFDPEFTDERYYWRLAKYVGRGFDLELPLIRLEDIKMREISADATMQYSRGIGRMENSVSYKDRMLARLPFRYRIGNLLSTYIPDTISEDLGTMLILISFFSVVPGTKQSPMYQYMTKILGEPREATPGIDPYGEINEEEVHVDQSLSDWVTTKRMVLRIPYESDVSISGPEDLLSVYRRSPYYKRRLVL